MSLLWEDAPNTAPTLTDTSAAPADQWTHIAISATNSGAYSFYINGAETGSGTTPASFLTSQNDGSLFLGSRNDLFTTLNGGLDEISIWDEALDATQVNSIFENGVTSVIPEPSTTLLGALATAFLLARRRRS